MFPKFQNNFYTDSWKAFIGLEMYQTRGKTNTNISTFEENHCSHDTVLRWKRVKKKKKKYKENIRAAHFNASI